MPHCILEYSNKIVDQTDFRKLLLEVNELLAGTGLFKQGNIKRHEFWTQILSIGNLSYMRVYA